LLLLQNFLLHLNFYALPNAVTSIELLGKATEENEPVLKVCSRYFHEFDDIVDEVWPVIETANNSDEGGSRAYLVDSGHVECRQAQLKKKKFFQGV
jgi:hypothetical protein